MTGSRTTFRARCRRRPRATARMRGASNSMPILTARGRKSEKTASICFVRNPTENVSMAVTARVF